MAILHLGNSIEPEVEFLPHEEFSTYEPYELTTAERDLRVAFVAQYLIDNSYINAAYRLEFTGMAAKDVAEKFFEDPLVQQLIAKNTLNHTDEIDPEDDLKIVRNQVRTGLLKAAHNYGHDATNASRVAALVALGKFEGLEKPKQVEATVITQQKPEFDFSKCDEVELALHRQLIDHQKNKKEVRD